MTKIEWTEATWNPLAGCSIVSPGCAGCYAMRMAARIERMQPDLAHYQGLTKPSKGGPVWTGKVALAPERTLTEPLRRRKPTMYFVNSMSDLFHEDVPDGWIDHVFAVMALSPRHTFQVLTKRSARMRDYVGEVQNTWAKPRHGGSERIRYAMCAIKSVDTDDGSTGLEEWPLPNVWLGVSAEDQRRADERIPDLLATPAAVRWVSAEPLLGPVDFGRYLWEPDLPSRRLNRQLDWIVVGGESGPGARPMHPDWARSIRDQCQAAGVPFFFKQWGNWGALIDRDRDDPDCRKDYSHVYADRGHRTWLNLGGGRGFHGERFHVMTNLGKRITGRVLDGRTWDDMPTREAVTA